MAQKVLSAPFYSCMKLLRIGEYILNLCKTVQSQLLNFCFISENGMFGWLQFQS